MHFREIIAAQKREEPEGLQSLVPDGVSAETKEVRGVTYFPESSPCGGCGAQAGLESRRAGGPAPFFLVLSLCLLFMFPAVIELDGERLDCWFHLVLLRSPLIFVKTDVVRGCQCQTGGAASLERERSQFQTLVKGENFKKKHHAEDRVSPPAPHTAAALKHKS